MYMVISLCKQREQKHRIEGTATAAVHERPR
jgi:hypothetical protein